MILKETPHIKLRKANGLINIDFTSCDIIGLRDESSQAAARSYNTIIGVYTRDSTDNKIYLETSGVYSTTTAGKHKPRARSLAAYNNYKIILDIKPEILHEQYFNNKYCIDEILTEAKQRQELIKQLKDGITTSFLITDLKVNGVIKAARNPEPHQYKNGNHQTKYYYKVSFKYCAPIYYQVIKKHIVKKVPSYNGPKGPKPETTTATITTRPAHIEY